MVMPSFKYAGSSFQSLVFACGKIMVFTLARRAAITFSLMPPTGKILPIKEISPVMAKSGMVALKRT